MGARTVHVLHHGERIFRTAGRSRLDALRVRAGDAVRGHQRLYRERAANPERCHPFPRAEGHALHGIGWSRARDGGSAPELRRARQREAARFRRHRETEGPTDDARRRPRLRQADRCRGARAREVRGDRASEGEHSGDEGRARRAGERSARRRHCRERETARCPDGPGDQRPAAGRFAGARPGSGRAETRRPGSRQVETRRPGSRQVETRRCPYNPRDGAPARNDDSAQRSSPQSEGPPGGRSVRPGATGFAADGAHAQSRGATCARVPAAGPARARRAAAGETRRDERPPAARRDERPAHRSRAGAGGFIAANARQPARRASGPGRPTPCAASAAVCGAGAEGEGEEGARLKQVY